MHIDDRIFVAGHRGMVGSAILRALQRRGYRNLITATHAQLDLGDPVAVRDFFSREKPAHVFLAAARVGGILANSEFPAEFIHQNLAIANSVIHQAWRCGVRRLLFLGSSCIYPRDCPQPMREDYLLTGPLEPTNRAYAVAKIAGVEMCAAYNRQYGSGFLAVMPTNLYGPGDNYDLKTSHVLPALVRKMIDAKTQGAPTVELWGTGRPRREFLHTDDLAEACLHLAELGDTAWQNLLVTGAWPLINVGCGEDLSIADLALRIRAASEYDGEIVWNSAMPDGTPRKLLDVSRLFALGWRPRIDLETGITQTCAAYVESRKATQISRMMR